MQPAPRHHVLFLCTGNSARSIMAEALINDPQIGGGRCVGYSAGSQPTGQVNPLALATLARHGIPAEGLRSKSWDEFAGPDAPQMDFVFTVCGSAAGETCPVWPGQPCTVHWGVEDPAAVTGSDAEKRRAFDAAFEVLRRRIKLFAALPVSALDARALRQRLAAIGVS